MCNRRVCGLPERLSRWPTCNLRECRAGKWLQISKLKPSQLNCILCGESQCEWNGDGQPETPESSSRTQGPCSDASTVRRRYRLTVRRNSVPMWKAMVGGRPGDQRGKVITAKVCCSNPGLSACKWCTLGSWVTSVGLRFLSCTKQLMITTLS